MLLSARRPAAIVLLLTLTTALGSGPVAAQDDSQPQAQRVEGEEPSWLLLLLERLWPDSGSDEGEGRFHLGADPFGGRFQLGPDPLGQAPPQEPSEDGASEP